jgi:hypothetical protein
MGAETQTALCTNGACSVCPAGTADCNGLPFDQCETTLATDPKNCGKCGQSCLLANTDSATCVASVCQISQCKPGFVDCDKKPENGCEASTSDDPNNCGGCGMACPAVANAKTSCLLGKCDKFACNEGFADCDGDPKNGCEVDLTKDLSNCGSCKTKCDAVAHGQAACNDGICTIGTCDKGFDDCDKSTGNGCEADLSLDSNNCASCGQKCTSLLMGTAVCKDSMCELGTCNPGYDDCDKAMPGCETNLSNSATSCGACGNKCGDVLHGKPGCDAFQCVIASCDKGFDHCVGDTSQGCETDISSDIDNCGKCGTKCGDIPNGTGKCEQSTCKIDACMGAFDDCNSDPSDGCETNKAVDPNHCGDCGTKCTDPPNGTSSCDGGQCAIKECQTGFANCDGDFVNGCEQATDSDPTNCGGCGVVCGTGICEQGVCACSNKVLLIADDSQDGSGVLRDAMIAAGLSVVMTQGPVWQYKGDPSPLDGNFGSVVVLSGGPATDPVNNSFTLDMPAEGQQAIDAFVKASNGLVLTEWAALHVSQGRWQTLSPYVLLQRTVAFTGQVTYNVDPSFKTHPVWNGLPDSFSLASTSNVGLVKVGSGNKRIATSPEVSDAVAIRDEANQGRVVHLAHAGNYQPNGWSNPNLQLLVSNAARWAARCTK